METTEDLIALGKEATNAFDMLLERAQSEQPPEHTLACRHGCSHCCYQPEVTVTAIEIFRVSAFITSHCSAEEITALISILPEPTHSPKPSSAPTPWVLIACPLLIDGACSVYDARPLVCRGANSYNVRDCQRAREQNRRQPTIHNYRPQEKAAHLTVDMLRQGIADTGRDAALLNLAPALAIALRQPDSAQRWLDGEQVFASARSNLRD